MNAHVRPIVADLARPGRMGIGTLLAPADPMVIVNGVCYRLDASMAVSRRTRSSESTGPRSLTFAMASALASSTPSPALTSRALPLRLLAPSPGS